MGLLIAAKARAYINDRTYVIPEDVRDLAVDVLAHRLIVKPEIRYKGRGSENIVKDLVEFVKVPKVVVHDE